MDLNQKYYVCWLCSLEFGEDLELVQSWRTLQKI